MYFCTIIISIFIGTFIIACYGTFNGTLIGTTNGTFNNTFVSRSTLSVLMWFLFRYMNHLQSLKFESKLYAMVKDKMEEMQQHNMSWIEVQFLKKSLDILCECRRTLMYTYVFAYYLRKNNQSAIFEDNQKDLESATEQLSE